MPSELFLAQTMAEFHQNVPLGAKKAWMGCHFSPYGKGLSNCPKDLPEGSMVIVTDEFPCCGHDADQIAGDLLRVLRETPCKCVLLDFQHANQPETARIAAALAEALPCPVGVSHWYAQGLDCPVFLPPLPLGLPLQQYLAPWQGRPVWLEVAMQKSDYVITKDGCKMQQSHYDGQFSHADAALCCHYQLQLEHDAAIFTLQRGIADLQELMKTEKVERFVGLYQEFAQADAQDTAFAQ